LILFQDGLIVLQLIIMNRFYYIDKPLNYSSFDVIRVLKKKLNIKKIGHSWTLDPLATGGLLIATWNYTKLIPYLEKDKKTYEFEISFDWTTDSFDLAEKINFLSEEKQNYFKNNLTKDKIKEILIKNFLGEITQIPPKYSALKINGQRAYKLAREGEKVNIKKRKINIFSIEILNYSYPKLLLKAEVSAWTYIRSIANDLWEILWTWWYITKLRRTKIASLDISKAQNLENFDKENFLEEKDVFKDKEFISLEKDILEKINNWLKVYKKFDFKKNIDLFVFDWEKITNIVSYDWEKLIPKRKI